MSCEIRKFWCKGSFFRPAFLPNIDAMLYQDGEVDLFSDEYFMREALKEAYAAAESDEVPVGAVVVVRNKIIAKAHNSTKLLKDVTAHAEILALTAEIPKSSCWVMIRPLLFW